MATFYYRSERRFQLWEFFVSHSQLLIRSPKGGSEERNVDIVFRGAEYISLPSHFEVHGGIEVREGAESDLSSFASLGDFSYPECRVFWVTSGPRRHVVIAAQCRVVETDCEFMEPGLQKPWDDVQPPAMT